MNIKKTIFAAGGIVVILILLAIRLGWFSALREQKPEVQKKTSQPAAKPVVKKTAEPAAKPAVKPIAKPVVKTTAEPAAKPTAKTTAETGKEEDLLGSGDPFVYSTAECGDYTPLSSNKNVGTIIVKGIICVAGEEPKAILHLKDSDRVHYVSKDSVIRVSAKNKTGTSSAETYIVVKNIRDDEVELIQLERPDKVIIIR